MPLIVNGTTIPENVANAFSFNGTNITSVICNGTTVWTQSLLNAIWSGTQSYAYTSTTLGAGMGFSGSLWRATQNWFNTWYYGSWGTAYTNGTFSNLLSAAYNNTRIQGYGDNRLATLYAVDSSINTQIAFNLSTKTWSTIIDNTANGTYRLEVSGAYMRFVIKAGTTISGTPGEWVTLT